MFSHLCDLQLEALILPISSESGPHPPLQTGTVSRTRAHLPRGGEGWPRLPFLSLGGKKGQSAWRGPSAVGRAGGGGGEYEPWFNPLPSPPRLSLAKAAATDAQQRQQSWSACKRKGDTVREGRGGAGVPGHPPSAPPRRAPALATRPRPAGPHGGPERAAGRAHASRRAHSMVRCGRGGCGRRTSSPPPRSAALQVRRQVGAAAAHIAGRARRASPAPAARAPSLPPAPACTAPPAAPGGGTGEPRTRAGARLRAQTAGGLCSRLPSRPCVCLCRGERLRLPGPVEPAGSSSAPEPSARLSTAR